MIGQPKPSKESRCIDFSGAVVPYVLKRYRGRSSVGLIVDHRGLTVTAPRRASDRYIVDAIREHAAWVLQKLAQWRDRVPVTVQWRDDVPIPYLGEPVRVMRDLFHSGAARLDGDVLRVAPQHDGDAMHAAVVQWYRAQAKEHFTLRIEDFCARFDLPRPKLIISGAQTRWGSCNAKREVRLSWRLLKAPPNVIDYVVAHELAHLKHMNHSAAFWAVVARLYPQYKSAQRILRRNDALYRSY